MKKPFSKLFGLKNKDEIMNDIEEDKNSQVEAVPIERIVPNRYQPRQVFEPAKISELAESIEEHGLLQPIVVRPIEEGMYEIIAGERRFRALSSLHYKYADVIIRQLNDEETAVVALIENIQRITERHARALLSLSHDEQESLLELIIVQKLNVKQTEARVKNFTAPEKVKAQTFGFTKDLTLAKEKVGESIAHIEDSGVHVERQNRETDDYYEIKIKLYKR